MPTRVFPQHVATTQESKNHVPKPPTFPPFPAPVPPHVDGLT